MNPHTPPSESRATSEAAPEPPRIQAPLWLLALLTFSGTFAMHIFVPALPRAAQEFGTSAASMQLTVSFYILGLAAGQLVYGPLSDRFGRRPILIVGLLIYTAAGAACAVAPDAQALVASRLLQALGGCAGLVLARAIVRDTALPAEAARRLALMNLMVTLGPGVAPIIGGAMASAISWRAIFVLLAAFGIVNLLLAWRLLPETGAKVSHDTTTLLRNYVRLVISPAFLGYAVGGGCATTSMYAFIASAPFILVNDLHLDAHEVGFILAVLVSGVWLGSVLTSRLIVRMPINRLLVGANAVSVVAAFVFLGAVLQGMLTVPLTVGTMFVFTLGVGVAAPAALTQAVSVDPIVVGSASGLYGFTQMTVGAICTALAGVGPDPALATALVLAGSGCLAQLSFWIAARDMRQTATGA